LKPIYGKQKQKLAVYRLESWDPEFLYSIICIIKTYVTNLMAFRMNADLNKHISYRPIKIENRKYCVTSSALAVDLLYYILHSY